MTEIADFDKQIEAVNTAIKFFQDILKETYQQRAEFLCPYKVGDIIPQERKVGELTTIQRYQVIAIQHSIANTQTLIVKRLYYDIDLGRDNLDHYNIKEVHVVAAGKLRW